MVRGVVVLVGLLAAAPAMAGEMSVDEARHFVIGKIFSYTCFEGTRGVGRVNGDGSVTGSIQIRGEGKVHYAALPPNTLRVKGEAVCASLRGLPMEPCFNLQRTDTNSFRGSVSGLGFAYCDFTRNSIRARATHRHTQAAPLALRPSLTADKN
jgi:hypothetical protein